MHSCPKHPNNTYMMFIFNFHLLFFFYSIILINHLINGQVQQTGLYGSKARQIYFGKRIDFDNEKLKVQVPFHDTEKLLEADEALKSSTNSKVHSGPFTFAKAIDIKIDSRTRGIWESEVGSDGVKTWSLLIESKTALGLALIFDHFRIPVGGELYVINDSGVLGAFTYKNNKADGKFSIQSLKGSSVFLVYIEAKKNHTSSECHFTLGKIVHSYRETFQTKASSGDCNVDVRCINSFTDQRRSTIVFMTDQLQKFCTGAMINNVKNDGKQYLLTANHCVFTDLSNSIAGFNYERLGCGTGAASSSTSQTAHGMKLIGRSSTSDFALFEVVEKIPQSYNAYLSGWDARVPDQSKSQTYAGIHHPSGDLKKISLYTGKLELASWAEGPSKKYHLAISRWSRGVTEPGSSGSPLFNSDGNLIGQLHGGSSSCTNLGGSDLYGGFYFSYGENGSGVSLKSFLGTKNDLIMPGRNLYPTSTNTATAVTATVTRTVSVVVSRTITTTAACPCVPKGIVDKLIDSYESRINKLILEEEDL